MSNVMHGSEEQHTENYSLVKNRWAMALVISKNIEKKSQKVQKLIIKVDKSCIFTFPLKMIKKNFNLLNLTERKRISV